MPYDGPTEFRAVLEIVFASGAEAVVTGGLAANLLAGDPITVGVAFAFRRRKETYAAIAAALAPYHPKPVDWPEGAPLIWDERPVANLTTLTLLTDTGCRFPPRT